MKTVASVRKTQSARILELLQSRGSEWTPASELAEIALQYCRAIHTLRSDGVVIENRTETLNGSVRGFYRLAVEKSTPSLERRRPQTSSQPEASLFPASELQRIARWADPEESGEASRTHLTPGAQEVS